MKERQNIALCQEKTRWGRACTLALALAQAPSGNAGHALPSAPAPYPSSTRGAALPRSGTSAGTYWPDATALPLPHAPRPKSAAALGACALRGERHSVGAGATAGGVPGASAAATASGPMAESDSGEPCCCSCPQLPVLALGAAGHACPDTALPLAGSSCTPARLSGTRSAAALPHASIHFVVLHALEWVVQLPAAAVAAVSAPLLSAQLRHWSSAPSS